jgi:hypothetical protein
MLISGPRTRLESDGVRKRLGLRISSDRMAGGKSASSLCAECADMSLLVLKCRGCGRQKSFTFPDDIGPPQDFLCKECGPRTMLDDLDWSDLGKTKLAQKVAWQREAEAQREIGKQGGESEDGYVVYRRKKDTARRFRRRNGFTVKDWRERVDQLGWRCSFCGCELTKTTVMRWSVDRSRKLQSQVPICRACHCRRVGSAKKRTIVPTSI